jgi:hypothetical protein
VPSQELFLSGEFHATRVLPSVATGSDMAARDTGSLIALAYFSIPITPIHLIRKRKACHSIGCSSASAF